VSVERETFPRMLEEAGGLFAFKTDAYWLDIGTPEKYVQAHLDVLRGAVGGHEPGDALLAAGAHVAPDAFVHASVLGPDARVERGAKVERSVLLEGAHVGADAQLTNAIVGPGGRVERGAVLDDFTIVGAGAVVPAGARLSRAKVAAGETPSGS
jgi:NDP-sugar pyrophosphorylase family protein